MNWDKVWDTSINKLHIAPGAVCQGSIIIYHFKTGHDLGPVVSTTVFAFYGFLLGHAGVYQRWPDKGDSQ